MPNLPNIESSLEALQALKETLSQIPRDQWRPFIPNHKRTWDLVAHLHHQAKAILPLLEAEYTPKRVAEIRLAHEELLRYGRAFYAVSAQFDGDSSYALRFKKPELRALEAELLQRRHFLFDWAKRVFAEHPTQYEALRHLSKGNGFHDAASDVMALAMMFQRHWDYVVAEGWVSVLAKKDITLERLNYFASRATEWLHLKMTPIEEKEVRRLRTQAFTALTQRYEIILNAGRALLPKQKWYSLHTRSRIKNP